MVVQLQKSIYFEMPCCVEEGEDKGDPIDIDYEPCDG